MRYEVAVEANLAFHTREGGAFAIGDFPAPETVSIHFEGRRFVWHAVALDDDGHERWPTVTTVIDDANDYEADRLATGRFLSALAYVTRQGIEVISGGAAGIPAEFDPPVATAWRRGLADHLLLAPAEVVVVSDERLRLVLGHYREGLSTGSAYFRFLAFWNALEIACEDLPRGIAEWLPRTMTAFPHLRGGDEPPPADWWDHLTNERRHAIAHAVREPTRGVPDLDPDDPESRARFHNDARLFDDLTRMRVAERWGEHAVYGRRV